MKKSYSGFRPQFESREQWNRHYFEYSPFNGGTTADLIKVLGRLAEEARIAIRNIRHEAMAVFKRMEHEGDMTEDDRKGSENALQEGVDKTNKEIDELARKKEETIMTL